MVDFFLAPFTLITSLPRREGSNSDSLDDIPPAGEPGATTTAAQCDTVQTRGEPTTNLKQRERQREEKEQYEE